MKLSEINNELFVIPKYSNEQLFSKINDNTVIAVGFAASNWANPNDEVLTILEMIEDSDKSFIIYDGTIKEVKE